MITKLTWTFIVLILLSTPLLCFWSNISYYDKKDPDGKRREAAIVLGAAVRGENPSPALEERLEIAYQLYSDYRITFIILTGGRGLGRSVSEAEVGKQYLIKKGIPDNRILLENKSSNTQENFKFVSTILKEHNLSDVYLVTHDYHMHRALYYAKQGHIDASPAPVHSKVMIMPLRKLQESYSYVKWKIVSLC